jgi:tetratricopeptide (TPR) repeat protein
MKKPYINLIPVILIFFSMIWISNITFGNPPHKKEITARAKIKNARLFSKANFEKNTGNISKARQLYLECLKYDPYDDASLYELGRIYLSLERFQDAELYASKAVNLDTSNEYYKLLLSGIYKMNGKFEQSIKILNALLEKKPDNYNYLTELAYLYILSQENDKAIGVLDKIEKKTGLNEFISNQKQQLYIAINKPEKAIEEIERLVFEFPYEIKYLGLLAEMCMQHGFEDKGLDTYKRILKIDPNDPYVHISMFDLYRKKKDTTNALNELKLGFANPKLDVDSKFQILLSFYTAEQIYTTKLKETSELILIMEKAHPNHPKAMAIKADLLYRDKKYKEARVLLRKVIEIEKDQYQWFEMLVIINSELRDIDAMETDSQKTIALFPNQPLPYLVLGLSKIQKDSLEVAKRILQKGVKLTGLNSRLKAQFYSYLGDCLHELKEVEASDNYYEKALGIDSINSVVLNNYSYYLAVRGVKLDKAEKMSAKSVEIDPNNSSNIDTRAWVLFKLNRYKEALEWIEKAFKIDDRESAELFEHYGDILYKLGEVKKAVKNWKKAKGIGEGSKFLDKKIKNRKIYE